MEKHLDTKLISVSQTDGEKFCDCENCRAVEAEEGSPAGALLRFVNAVASDIAEDYHDVVIDTLAYLDTHKAPKITKLLSNVCIRLCSILNCVVHPIEERCCDDNFAIRPDAGMYDWGEEE